MDLAVTPVGLDGAGGSATLQLSCRAQPKALEFGGCMGFSVNLGLWTPIGLWDLRLFAGWGLLGMGLPGCGAGPSLTALALHPTVQPRQQVCSAVSGRRGGGVRRVKAVPNPNTEMEQKTQRRPAEIKPRISIRKGKKGGKPTLPGPAAPPCFIWGFFWGGGGLWGGLASCLPPISLCAPLGWECCGVWGCAAPGAVGFSVGFLQ